MFSWCAFQSLLIDQHKGMLPALVATFNVSLIRMCDERRKT